MHQGDIQIPEQQAELRMCDHHIPEVTALHFHRQQTVRARIVPDRHHFKMISGEQVSVPAATEAVALMEVVAMAPVLLVLVHHIHHILRDMVLQQVQIINLHRHIPVDLPVVVHMTIGKFIN